MFIQHLEPLRFIQILLTLILLRFRYLSKSHTTVCTMIVILKQVVWGISAIEGTINNDCHQNIFQTAALSLTWNTEVRIQPICYSNPLGKFIHSYSSTSPKISLQHFLSQAKSEWSPMASSVSELCCNRSGRSLFSSFYT